MTEPDKKSIFNRVLTFLNLLEANRNRLSITNVLIYAITIKLLFVATIDLAAAGTLLTVIFNYGHKRYIDNKNNTLTSTETATATDAVDALKKQIEDLKQKIVVISRAVGLIKEDVPPSGN